MKRFRRVNAVPNELLARYGRDDCGNVGVIYAGPKSDSAALVYAFEETASVLGEPLVTLLRQRGYDITTLCFTIKKLAARAAWEAAE